MWRRCTYTSRPRRRRHHSRKAAADPSRHFTIGTASSSLEDQDRRRHRPRRDCDNDSARMPRSSVPKEALNAACDEFQRQLRAWEDDEAHDGEDCCGIRVVIARGVTEAMVKRIPESWLKGLVVSLSANGDLELMDVEGFEHRHVRHAVDGVLGAYEALRLQQNGIDLGVYTELPGIYHGSSLKPDCVLSAGRTPAGGQERPLVIVEIEIHNLSVPEIIKKARLYLSELHVQRVVVFKFFRAGAAGLRLNPPLLQQPALAVVFDRVGTFRRDGLAHIRVVDEVSFGTGPLDRRVLRSLSAIPSVSVPFRRRIRPVAASRYEFPHVQMVVGNVLASFAVMDALNVPVRNALTVDPNAHNLPLLTFDLGEIFKQAARGWTRDHFYP